MKKINGKKVAKIALCALLGILAFAVLAVLALPLWFGPVTRTLANTVMPKMALAEFSLGRASASPYTGRLELGNVLLGNPAGYSEPRAATVGRVLVDVDMSTLMADYLRLEDVTVSDVFVTVETGGEYDVDNFTQLNYNMAGGKDAYERKKSRKKKSSGETKLTLDHVGLHGFGLKCSVPGGTMTGMLTVSNLTVDVNTSTVAGDDLHFGEVSIRDALITYVAGGNRNKVGKTASSGAADAQADGTARTDGTTEEPKAEAAKTNDTKIVIDRLVMSDLRLQCDFCGLRAVMPVPTIELADLGKSTQGMTLEEFGDQLWQAILKGATKSGEGARMLQLLLKRSTSDAFDIMGSGAKTLKMDKASDAVSSRASKTAKALGSGTGAAVDAVGTSVKAVGDGAKKATDALKGLFN